jgi:glycosyltransferase 2 family protein
MRGGRARLLILGVVLAAVGVIAYTNRGHLSQAAQLMGRVSLLWLPPAVLAIGGVYLCRAAVYDVTLKLLGYTLGRGYLWSTALVATSLYQLLPAGGAGGYAFLAYAFHQRGVAVGEASLIALVDTLSNAISIATLVVVSLIYLTLSGDLRIHGVLVALGPAAVIIVLVAYVYRLQTERESFVQLVLRWKNRFASLLRRRWSDQPIRNFLDQYYDGKELIRRHRGAFYTMVGLQYLAIGCDCVALYLVLAALGVFPRVWVVFMGLVVSMAGLAIVAVPGGGGSFEVIMSAFLAGNGLHPAAAIAAAILYRAVAFWLPAVASVLALLPIQHRAMRRASEDREAPQQHHREE